MARCYGSFVGFSDSALLPRLENTLAESKIIMKTTPTPVYHKEHRQWSFPVLYSIHCIVVLCCCLDMCESVFKVLLIGGHNVGKTTFVASYVLDKWIPNLKTTIGGSHDGMNSAYIIIYVALVFDLLFCSLSMSARGCPMTVVDFVLLLPFLFAADYAVKCIKWSDAETVRLHVST